MYRIQKRQPDLLTNFDIDEMCVMFGIPLIGVYSKDQLEDIEPEVGCYVINLEDSTEGGSHWTAIVINETYVSYFDSFAVRPPDDVKEFIGRYVKNQDMETIYNLQQIQEHRSVLCGYYCVYFCYFHTILYSDSTDNKKLMSKHNKIYLDIYNLKMNDRIIQKLIKDIIV
jgi:hypothetical protein